MTKAHDQIIKAKIQLQKEKPFFAYLILHLKIGEDLQNLLPEYAGCGVNQAGNLIYKPEWITTLTLAQTKAVLCHEVLHLALNHIKRADSRDKKTWNIASDIVANNLLNREDFPVIPNAINPTHNQIEIYGTKVNNISDKSAEQIYSELLSKPQKDKPNTGQGGGDTDNQQDNNQPPNTPQSDNKEPELTGYDEHIIDGEMTTEQQQRTEQDWKSRLVEAQTFAKQRGELSGDIQRLVESVITKRLNWRALLTREIQNILPSDWTYGKVSKRAIATGHTLPSMKKENINIYVAIDTSGSISQKEISVFTSQIKKIATSFKNIQITLITCDCEIQDTFILTGKNYKKIDNLNIRGGGGTSHIPIFEYIQAHKSQNNKLLVCLTDGYTSFPKTESIRTIWVITPEGKTETPFGKVIKLKE